MSKKVKSLILALVMLFTTFANVNANPKFECTTQRDQKIENLKNRGYIYGYNDGSLRLENTITRSEFSTIVVYVLEKQEEAKRVNGESKPFNDVEKNTGQMELSQ